MNVDLMSRYESEIGKSAINDNVFTQDFLIWKKNILHAYNIFSKGKIISKWTINETRFGQKVPNASNRYFIYFQGSFFFIKKQYKYIFHLELIPKEDIDNFSIAFASIAEIIVKTVQKETFDSNMVN